LLIACCVDACPAVSAQEASGIDKLIWQRNVSTGVDVATSIVAPANDCLSNGLAHAFGVSDSAPDADGLLNACALYEGRRLGLRDRQGLSAAFSRLRRTCLSKSNEQE
jgi:hypothetical protein